jgi:hypothetical protein
VCAFANYISNKIDDHQDNLIDFKRKSVTQTYRNKFATYQIKIPGIATAYIAYYKGDNKTPSLYTSENSVVKDPRKLVFTLENDFAYGGSRLAKYLPNKSRGAERAIKSVNFLALAESHMKHALVNKVLEEGALDKLVDRRTYKLLNSLKAQNELQSDIEAGYKLPAGYFDLKVKGARCMILPETEEIELILKDPNHVKFCEISEIVFEKIGRFLNGVEAAKLTDLQGKILGKEKIKRGKINITPDFGRFAATSNMLNKYTPQVLCVNTEAGGSNGKVAYTVTGILAGLQACIDNKLCSFNSEKTKITFIGSAGALGEVIVEYLREKKFQHVTLCDLQYDLKEQIAINDESDLDKLKIKNYVKHNDSSYIITTLTDKKIKVLLKDKLVKLTNDNYQVIPNCWKIIPAVEGKYTDEALTQDSEIILSTAVGKEIENSNYHLIHSGTLFLAAHNMAISLGSKGLKIVKDLAKQNVICVPGQVLTLGGALTSRLEACHRAEHKIIKSNEGKNIVTFPKRLAHEIVKDIIYHITTNIDRKSVV